MHSIKKNETFSVNKRNGLLLQMLQESTNKTNKNYGDRFIPRRYLLEQNESNLKFAKTNSTIDVLSIEPYNRYSNYINYLKTLLCGPERRILALSDPSTVQQKACLESIGNIEKDWSCRPRKIKHSSVYATYVLSNLPYQNLKNRMFSWSVKNEMACVMGNVLMVWHLGDMEPDQYLLGNSHMYCLSYSPCGKLLVMGGKAMEICLVGVHEFAILHIKLLDIEIRCLTWSHIGDCFVGGTSNGTIYIFDLKLKVVRELKVFKRPIVNIEFSPNMLYMASSDMRGNVAIHHWNSCELCVHLKPNRVKNSKIKSFFSFHPWNDNDIALAESSPAALSIMHLPSRKVVAHYTKFDMETTIDHISFNKITAELLVSCIGKDGDGDLEQRLHIFSSFSKIVEVVQLETGCCRFLMWSADGGRMVTLDFRPALIVWDYNCDKNVPQKKVIQKLTPHSEMHKWETIR